MVATGMERNRFSRGVVYLLFAKTRQTPTIPSLMVADAPGRAMPYMLRMYLGSVNPS